MAVISLLATSALWHTSYTQPDRISSGNLNTAAHDQNNADL